MHYNLWGTLILTLIPSVLVLLVAVILWIFRKKGAKISFILSLSLLLLPAIFIISHFWTIHTEMKKRSGTFIVSRQYASSELCKDTRYDSLLLTLESRGIFYFNFRPCFYNKTTGRWKWYEDMVTTGTSFEKINDSLYLYFPDDHNTDSIILTKYQQPYLVFTRINSFIQVHTENK